MRGLGEWNRAVHAHCIETREPITPQQAQALFGKPDRASSANMLNSACVGGYFEREEWLEEGHSKQVVRFCYRAVEKQLSAQDHRTSYFAGLQRVRSVFDLGAVL